MPSAGGRVIVVTRLEPSDGVLFSSLPTGGVRWIERKGREGFIRNACRRNPFLPFPREGIAQGRCFLTPLNKKCHCERSVAIANYTR
jgi:hypothetical protein